MALKKLDRGEANGASYTEKWLLEYSSPNHRMSAPPPVQQITSADAGDVVTREDISEYCKTLQRANISIGHIRLYLGKCFFKWTDIIFNYEYNKKESTAIMPVTPSYTRLSEVAIGECRITTQKSWKSDIEGQVGQAYGHMKTYARVGIPVAVAEAIKMHVRRATINDFGPDADFPGSEEVSHGLRWMYIELAREGVNLVRVTQETATHRHEYRASRLTALETEKVEVPCVLFLTVRVSQVMHSHMPSNRMIHFRLVECHHMVPC